MNIIHYPERSEWKEILKRSALHTEDIRDAVNTIINKVRTEGDRAIIAYEEQFDKVKLESLAVDETEFKEAENMIAPERSHPASFSQHPYLSCSPAFRKQKNRNHTGRDLLAKSCSH